MEMSNVPEQIVSDVPVIAEKKTKLKRSTKKAEPVPEPVVEVVSEVLDEVQDEVQPEPICAIMDDDMDYKKAYEDLLIKYNALVATKTRVVRAKADPKYAMNGKTYEAEKLSETKTDGLKVPEDLYGVKVMKGKCGSDILFQFKVIKYDKKGLLPLIVKCSATGRLYKNAGGAIEVSEGDELYRVYLLKNLKQC